MFVFNIFLPCFLHYQIWIDFTVYPYSSVWSTWTYSILRQSIHCFCFYSLDYLYHLLYKTFGLIVSVPPSYYPTFSSTTLRFSPPKYPQLAELSICGCYSIFIAPSLSLLLSLKDFFAAYPSLRNFPSSDL